MYYAFGAYVRGRVVSIPMTVFGGLQFFLDALMSKTSPSVSIPMTVFGGLQCHQQELTIDAQKSFNTDDGIWRATI